MFIGDDHAHAHAHAHVDVDVDVDVDIDIDVYAHVHVHVLGHGYSVKFCTPSWRTAQEIKQTACTQPRAAREHFSRACTQNGKSRRIKFPFA